MRLAEVFFLAFLQRQHLQLFTCGNGFIFNTMQCFITESYSNSIGLHWESDNETCSIQMCLLLLLSKCTLIRRFDVEQILMFTDPFAPREASDLSFHNFSIARSMSRTFQ